MIILIGSQKGGCGKSTTCVNIASELVRQGKDVVLVDADRQGTSSNWISDRNNAGDLNRIHSIQKFDNIRCCWILRRAMTMWWWIPPVATAARCVPA
ncbi:ParA family protein [Sodalis praecaptivus]|uniref:ParA family protein n=1 Tax=Sodalis praecaptivus TaxID=1239307 RepID=UPI0027FF7EC7|nr:ParA family protein [Sodalis praecaptivus]CAJ0992667.1 Iron-sulfur cluster carrier protein [Sodalis praecaptivus]